MDVEYDAECDLDEFVGGLVRVFSGEGDAYVLREPEDLGVDTLFDTGLSLGLDRSRFANFLRFARLVDSQSGCVLEVASGKGYLSRLLHIQFKRQVVCVDKDDERNRSSVRVARLLDDGPGATRSVVGKAFDPIHAVSSRIDSIADMERVVDSTKEVFMRGVPLQLKDGKMVPRNKAHVCVCGLNLCGDLAITVLESWNAVRNTRDWLSCGSIVVSPCCFHLNTRFPCSERLKGLDREILQTDEHSHLYQHVRTLLLLDLAFYAEQLHWKARVAAAGLVIYQ